MKRAAGKSHCPINYSLEIFGDQWSLLILRDIVCYNKHTFGEFLQSKEKISTRMLTMRLQALQDAGIIAVGSQTTDKRVVTYELTAKGAALVPVLIGLATWGSTFDPQTSAPQSWKDAVAADAKLPDNAQRHRLPAFVADAKVAALQ